MRIKRPELIIGAIGILFIGYWYYKRYRSKKAIEEAKNNELNSQS